MFRFLRKRCTHGLRYYVDEGGVAHAWTPSPVLSSGRPRRGSGSGVLTAVLADQGGVAGGTAPALTATSAIPSSKAVARTVVLPPA